jgi:hypothetical protein
MRHDIPGPVHAHVNAMMLRAVTDADHTAPVFKLHHAPQNKTEAAWALSTFIETADTDMHYRWRSRDYFLAVPEWAHSALASLSSTVVAIPGWENPPPHSDAETWYAVGFRTACSPLQTLLYTSRDWMQAVAFPCDTSFLHLLQDENTDR